MADIALVIIAVCICGVVAQLHHIYDALVDLRKSTQKDNQ